MNLKAVRRRRGLVQEDLAALSGVSRSTIAELEAGRRKARAATIRALANALRSKPERLY